MTTGLFLAYLHDAPETKTDTGSGTQAINWEKKQDTGSFPTRAVQASVRSWSSDRSRGGGGVEGIEIR